MESDSDETTGVLLPVPSAVAGSQGLPCLQVLSGEAIGHLIPLTQSRTLIGRASHCDLVLRTTGISREHAEVVRAGIQEVWVRDLNSTNGITLNGQPVVEGRLQGGDDIGVLGQPLLRFLYQKSWQVQRAAKVQDRASADPLTGAFSARYLSLRLEEELALAPRKRLRLCLLAVRPLQPALNGDSEGERSLLIALAERLEGLLPTEDVLARWEGTTFVALLRGKSWRDCQKIARRVEQHLAEVAFPANAERPTSQFINCQWGLFEWAPEMRMEELLQKTLEQLG
jgi:GGDEF domain-containing protein